MTDTQNDLLARDGELNRMIQTGEAMEAFEKFYAEDVVMAENDQEPTRGKDANREREKEFFANVTEFRAAEVLARGVGEDVTFSLWRNDFTHKEWGEKNYRQVAVRRWRDGLIVEETFFYGG